MREQGGRMEQVEGWNRWNVGTDGIEGTDAIRHGRMQMKKKKIYWKIIIGMAVASAILNLLAFSTDFCDWYADTVYVRISEIYGRVMNFFPVVFGEILMYLAALLVFFGVISLILLIFLRKKERYRSFVKCYMKTVLCVFAVTILVYTLNWIIPFRSSLLGHAEHSDREYTTEEIKTLRNYIVEQLNQTCLEVPRDSAGHVVYPDKGTINQSVAEAMQKISDQYPRLSGDYPAMKAAYCSDVLDWMWIGGYTYPYTMEITYNKYTGKLRYPSLFAHESAHHKGYYRENEANFLSYLGCVNCDLAVAKYSALLDMYYYIEDACVVSLTNSGADEKEWEEYEKIKVLDQVWDDEAYSLSEAEEVYEQDSHPAEDFSEVAEDAAEVGWDTQGEILAEDSYDGVVTLALEYYEGILY